MLFPIAVKYVWMFERLCVKRERKKEREREKRTLGIK